MTDDTTTPPPLPVRLRTDWEPTEDDIKKIEAYAGIGMNLKQIADLLAVPRSLMTQRAAETPAITEAYETGESKAIAVIANVSYNNAREPKNMIERMFWLKSRAGWRDVDAANTASQTVVLNVSKDAEKRILRASGLLAEIKQAADGRSFEDGEE